MPITSQHDNRSNAVSTAPPTTMAGKLASRACAQRVKSALIASASRANGAAPAPRTTTDSGSRAKSWPQQGTMWIERPDAATSGPMSPWSLVRMWSPVAGRGHNAGIDGVVRTGDAQ